MKCLVDSKRMKRLKKYAFSRLPKCTESGTRFDWKIYLVTPISGYNTKTGKPRVEGMSFVIGFDKWHDGSDKWNSYKMAVGRLNGEYDIHSSFQGMGDEWEIEYFYSRSRYIIHIL